MDGSINMGYGRGAKITHDHEAASEGHAQEAQGVLGVALVRAGVGQGLLQESSAGADAPDQEDTTLAEELERMLPGEGRRCKGKP